MSDRFGGLPPLIKRHAENALGRVSSFLGGHDSLRVFFITDVHAMGNGNLDQYRYLYDVSRPFEPDLLINGGDIGLSPKESPEEAERVLNGTASAMARFPEPFFFLKGNHDYGPLHVPNHELNRLLNGGFASLPSGKAHAFLDEPEGGGYGYYIDEKTRSRLFFLNTSEGDLDGYHLSVRQLERLRDFLLSAEGGERIVIFAHRDIDMSGAWKSYHPDLTDESTNIPLLRSLLEAFAARGSLERDGISADFGKVDPSARLLGYIAGDSHFFNDHTERGVRYIVRQGYGCCPESEMPAGAHKTIYYFQKAHPFLETECDFDLLVLRGDGPAKLFCIGPGEEALDMDLS
jgi:3',5'-cyclic AMP phosphodiesterase CpdA